MNKKKIDIAAGRRRMEEQTRTSMENEREEEKEVETFRKVISRTL